MLVLIGEAAAAEGHLAVSGGVRWATGLAPNEGAFGLGGHAAAEPTVRVEAGAGSKVQVYGVAQLTTYAQPAYYYAWRDGNHPPKVGHVFSTDLGVGGRLPFEIGRLRLVPQVDVGLALADSPVDAEAEEEIRWEGRFAPAHSVGGWVQVGTVFGWEVIPDAVTLFAAPHMGFELGTGLDLTFGPFLGASARL